MRDNNIIQEAIDTLKRLRKENTELKAENARLKEELTTYGATGICETCTDKANIQADKYHQTLQEIKKIAEQILNKNEFVYMSYRDVRQIIRLIIKAEEE